MIGKDICQPTYLSPSTPVFIQIRSLVGQLISKKITKVLKNELLALVNCAGWEAERFMFVSLMQQIELKEIKEKATVQKVTLLGQLLAEISPRENFIFYFADAVAASSKNPCEYVQAMVKYIKLQLPIQIVVALAMYLSDQPAISKEGQSLLKQKLNEYYQLGKPVEFPPKMLEEMLFQIGKNPQLLQDMHDEYEYLLETSSPERIPEVKCYHYLNNNYRVASYEAPTVVKASQLIKKSELLRDLGPYCTFNIESLKTVLNDLGQLTEEDVFECLMLMSESNVYVGDSIDRFMTDLVVANKKNVKAEDWRKFYQNQDLTEKKMQASWNVEYFLTYAVQNVPNLKWTSVMGYFDRLDLEFTSPEAFLNMFRSFQKAKKQGPKFKTPEILFFKKWNHPKSQLKFLLQVFKCEQPDVFGLTEITNKKTARWLAESLKSSPNQHPLQTQLWGYLDMVQLLVELSEYNFMAVRELFDSAMRAPDLLLQTLSEIKPTRGDALLDEIFSNLFPPYLSNHTSYIRLLESLWENNDDLVISSICELYKNENKKENSCLNLSRVLDITQNIRESLIPLTYWNDYGFAVALGILAGKREFLHFEQWVKERLKSIGTPFLSAILQYVEDNLLKQIREIIGKIGTSHPNFPPSLDIALEKAQLSRQLLAFIFESALQISGQKFTIRTVQTLKRLYKQICQYFPEMSESQLPDEIELLAQKQFHRIYKQEITLQAAIDMMLKLKNSSKQEEKELYASMITFLFTELRFHSNYPEKELMITANFFAAIINANLIERKLINVFLQVLKDDLKQANKKFDFAVAVIEKIKGKLTDEPEFCEALVDIDLLLTRNPQIVHQLIGSLTVPNPLSPEKQLALKNALDAKNQPKIVAPVPVERPPQNPQSDPDLLEAEDRSKRMNSEKEKKIMTLFNTLSTDSINEKWKELQKLLDSKETIKAVSYQIVLKRASNIQQNSVIEMYLSLISKIPRMERYVIKLSYKILDKWFHLQTKSQNDIKIKQFRNLGYWLGKLTLARNEPVLISRLNLKEILINSYKKKTRLTPNVQVVIKILEAAKDSKTVFSVRNPWLAPILCVLRELQDKVTDNQVKSEVIRLFRNNQIEESELPETDYLCFPIYPNEGKTSLTILELPNFVQVNEQELGHFVSKGIDLKKIIAQSVDAAIQEIVPPVIARSVTIALVTTKQIALKDFALEPDDRKLLRGTHLIVQNLAGSLALVTCREPLKMSLTNFLKKKLEEFTFLTETDKDSIINAASRDNLDLGCALIKKAVIEKALEDINKDSAINEQIERRREAQSKREMFRNEMPVSQEIADTVPEQLRPRIGGLSEEEFKIYEDFQKDKRSTNFIEKKTDSPKERQDRLITAIRQNEPLPIIKDIILKSQYQPLEIAQKTQQLLLEDRENIAYYIEVLKLFKDSTKPSEVYESFSEKIPNGNRDYENAVIELAAAGYFPANAPQDYLKKHRRQSYDDPAYEQYACQLLEEWMSQFQEIKAPLESLSERFNKGNDDEVKKFFYFTLKYATEKALESGSQYCESLDYRYIDEYSKLIIVFLKIVSNNRSVYLEHVCEAIRLIVNKFHESDVRPFNQRPFFKLILNLIYDVSRKPYGFDTSTILTMYTVFTHLLDKLQPLNYPGFSFAWLELVSNKYFMPTILDKEGFSDLYHQLLVDLLNFAQIKLTVESLNSEECHRAYYKGIVRVVTMLLHDFPDFLSEFSLSLCNHTADRFVQIRNIILSAFPKALKFPEPQNLAPNASELDKIENSNRLPKYYQLKFDKTYEIAAAMRNQEKFHQLKLRLEKQSAAQINLFVLHVAWSVYEAESGKNSQLEEESIKFMLQLLAKCDNKPALVRGVLNQVRFPNLITVFFIKTMSRALFEQSDTPVQQQLVRAIMQRMKIEKPHPWGLIFVTNQMKQLKKKLVHLNLPEIADL